MTELKLIIYFHKLDHHRLMLKYMYLYMHVFWGYNSSLTFKSCVDHTVAALNSWRNLLVLESTGSSCELPSLHQKHQQEEFSPPLEQQPRLSQASKADLDSRTFQFIYRNDASLHIHTHNKTKQKLYYEVICGKFLSVVASISQNGF